MDPLARAECAAPDAGGAAQPEMTEISLEEPGVAHLTVDTIGSAETKIELFPDAPSDDGSEDEVTLAAAKDVEPPTDGGNKRELPARFLRVLGFSALWAFVGLGTSEPVPLKTVFGDERANRLPAPGDGEEGDGSTKDEGAEGHAVAEPRALCARICRIIGLVQCVAIFLALLCVFVAVLMTTVL